MKGAATRYRELLIELLIERKLNGGRLTDQTEAERAAQLDMCWQSMSGDEQDEAEIWWKSAPGGPERLSMLDVNVDKGEHLLPRRAA